MKRCLAVFWLILAMSVPALASSTGLVIPADEALQMLKDGNTRYADGKSVHGHQGPDRRTETATGGQHPFATIIGCSDSRAPLEVVFDQGVGDIFVIRVAGNVAAADELGSIEYGVGHLGTPIVLVLGHTGCGAVTAAVENAKVHGNIPALINQIKPAVAKAKSWTPTASGKELLAKSIQANVWLTMENILRKSPEVREFVQDGRALLVGGIYDLTTGKVNWLGQHPDQGKIIAGAHMAAHKPKPKPKPKPKAEGENTAQDSAVDAAAEAKPEAHAAEAKPEAKPEAKAPAKTKGKSAKPAAKPAEEVYPTAKSEGDGELLAPTDKPAKAAHAPAAKAHQ